MGAVRFGAFILDPSRRVLRRGDEEVALRPQSLDVLMYLAQHSRKAVTRRELLDRFWAPEADADDSLAHCIRDIRVALGDRKQEIIKTIPRHGFRFEAAVSAVPEAASEPIARIGSHAPPEVERPLPEGGLNLNGGNGRRRYALAGLVIVVVLAAGWALRSWTYSRPIELTMMAVPSIAVLPFKSAGKQWTEASGDSALADEIATQLLRVPRGFRIFVRSAASYKDKVAEPKTVGRELGVRYIVLGSMSSVGDAVRVNVQLLEAESGRQIWADPFDYVPGEAAAQHRAAARIARLLTDAFLAAESKRPLPAEPTADHYAILGRALLSGRGSAKVYMEAMAVFKRGLKLDGKSVPALQGYARTKISAVDNGWAPRDQRTAWLDQAEEAIARVIDQRPRSYGAYRLRGSLLRARGDPEQAIKAFERALELNDSYGSAYAELGRTKIEVGRASETIGDVKKAIAFSTTDPAIHTWLFWAGQAAVHVEEYHDALEWLQKAQEADPAYESPVPWLALAHAGLGRMDRARAIITGYLAKNRNFTIAGWKEDHPQSHPVVAVQRERIARMLHELGVPEAEVKTGSKQ